MGLTSRYHRLNKFVEDFVRVEKREKEKTKVSIISFVYMKFISISDMKIILVEIY